MEERSPWFAFRRNGRRYYIATGDNQRGVVTVGPDGRDVKTRNRKLESYYLYIVIVFIPGRRAKMTRKKFTFSNGPRVTSASPPPPPQYRNRFNYYRFAYARFYYDLQPCARVAASVFR